MLMTPVRNVQDQELYGSMHCTQIWMLNGLICLCSVWYKIHNTYNFFDPKKKNTCNFFPEEKIPEISNDFLSPNRANHIKQNSFSSAAVFKGITLKLLVKKVIRMDSMLTIKMWF